MKYYSIKTSTELKDIGKYPQSWVRPEFNSETADSYLNVKPEEFPSFYPKYELTLADDAYATDLIDRGPLILGQIVSEGFRDILETMNLPPHRFYSVNVYHKGDVLRYFWFHHISNMWNYIDLQRTKVLIFNLITREILEEVPVKSVELIEQRKKLLTRNTAMRFEEVYLNNDFPKFDFFELRVVQYIDFVSENLKTIIEREKITGCNLQEYNRLRGSDKN